MSHDVSWTHVKGPEHCSNADMDQDTMYMYIYILTQYIQV